VSDEVDYTRQTADSGDAEWAERMVRILRRELPDYWVWRDPQATKRMQDELAGALSGQDTSEQEDARLEQSNPNRDVNPSADPIFGDEVSKEKSGTLRVRQSRRL
jgi:hypothetical protein